MKQNFPNNNDHDLIDMPCNSLKSKNKNNYSPQPNKLDGYSQMPL